MNELDELTLVQVSYLESIFWSALCQQSALAEGSKVAHDAAVRAAGAACELRVLYLWVAHEIGARTAPGRRRRESERLDWPAGARGRHRIKAERAGLQRADRTPATDVTPVSL